MKNSKNIRKGVTAFVCVILFNGLSAQTKTTSIPFEIDNVGLMNIDVTLNDFTQSFIFDTGASEIVINLALFREMQQKGYISSRDMIGDTQVIIADGSVVNATVVKLKTVQVGSFTLYDINAIVMPGPNAPLLIGQNLFSKFGKMTIDYQNETIELETTQNSIAPPVVSNPPPSPSTNPGPAPRATSVLVLNELKIIPCNRSKVSEIAGLENILDAELEVVSFSQENNIPPPQRAVDRIIGDITVRYFDTQDYEVAQKIKDELSKRSKYNGADIRIENMLPYFNFKSIPSYIEIWLK